MVVDFQHHYTPPELIVTGKGDGTLLLDEAGNPNYRFNPLLADLSAHVRMMDKAGNVDRHYAILPSPTFFLGELVVANPLNCFTAGKRLDFISDSQLLRSRDADLRRAGAEPGERLHHAAATSARPPSTRGNRRAAPQPSADLTISPELVELVRRQDRRV